jgi:hypothetical protein
MIETAVKLTQTTDQVNWDAVKLLAKKGGRTDGTLLTKLNNSPPVSFFFRADLLGKDKGVVYYLTNLIKR